MDRLLQRDLTVRVLSILLALILWLQVNADESTRQRKVFDRVPAEVQNLPADLAIADPDDLAVRITLLGQPAALARVRGDDLHPTVDLRGARTGIASYPVDVQPPKGLGVAEVSPARLTLRVEPRVSRRVPLFVEVGGEPAQDLQAGKPEVPTAEATVSGPRSIVEQVTSVFGWADIKGAKADAKVRVRLLPVDRAGREVRGLTIAPEAVEVSVPVRPAAGAVKPVIPRLAGAPAAGFRVLSATAAPGQVTVRGAADRVRAISGIETAPVQVNDVRASFKQEVDLVAPLGADALVPKRVTVLVEVGPDVVSRTIEGLRLTARNLAPGLSARLEPEQVAAVVEGPSRAVAQLGDQDVRLFVDLASLGRGTHRLQVQASLPAGMRLIEARPRSVEVLVR